MIVGTAKLSDYGKANVTVTFTATVDELAELQRLMKEAEAWPASDFARFLREIIDKTLGQVRATFSVSS